MQKRDEISVHDTDGEGERERESKRKISARVFYFFSICYFAQSS